MAKKQMTISETRLHNIISETIKRYITERLDNSKIARMFRNFIGNLDSESVAIIRQNVINDNLMFTLRFPDKGAFNEVYQDYLKDVTDLESDAQYPFYIVKEMSNKPIVKQDGSVIWDICVASVMF